MNKHFVLFANISYCFDGDMGGEFRYVKETGDAGEKYNFSPFAVNGENVCWGFFEPGFTKGGYDGGGRHRKLNLERIDMSFKNALFADAVTVIWCAQIEKTRAFRVIGWYKNSKVYRNMLKFSPEDYHGRGLKEFGYEHNVEALAESCVLLPIDEIASEKWVAPRKKAGGFGFGQSNMWYATEPPAQGYVSEILEKINNYSGKNEIGSGIRNRC